MYLEFAKLNLIQISWGFDDLGDEYLKERKSDIDYIGERITRNILGRKRQDLSNIKEKSIIVANDLSPADTANLDVDVVMGFVTNTGGKTLPGDHHGHHYW